MTVESVLIQLNTSFTPSGRFPVYGEPVSNGNGTETRIGCDVAVCIQKYEPWIVETYNTSIASPSILRIVGKGDGSTLLPPSGNIRGAPVASTRHLNTEGKDHAFTVAYGSTVNLVWKDNNLGGEYTPTPTVGPVTPPRTTFLLTPAYPTDHFFHQWYRALGIHRTLPEPARKFPWTTRCG